MALAEFWKIARHWKQGDNAMLELSCKAGSLLMQLTAKLGHPDLPHFPSTTLPPVFKKKSPSRLRCQERWRQEAPNKETQKTILKKYTVDTTLPVTGKSNLPTEPTKPIEPILKWNHCEQNCKTDKGMEIHIGKAYKTISLQSPEKEHISFPVNEPTLTITPRENKIETVIPEDIIDCSVKTEGLHNSGDCDLRTNVETEMMNHIQIKHTDPT